MTTKGYQMSTPITIDLNFRGETLTVTGHKPYRFPEEANSTASFVIAKASSWQAPYDSAEHLVGHASGWGMQNGKISNSVHFSTILDRNSEKISFSDLELYISKEEYERLKEIITNKPYTMNDWANDAHTYLMTRYGVMVPKTFTNQVAKELSDDGVIFKAFNNGFFVTEAHLSKFLDLDPADLVKTLWSERPDTSKAYWKKFYKTAKDKGVQIITIKK